MGSRGQFWGWGGHLRLGVAVAVVVANLQLERPLWSVALTFVAASLVQFVLDRRVRQGRLGRRFSFLSMGVDVAFITIAAAMTGAITSGACWAYVVMVVGWTVAKGERTGRYAVAAVIASVIALLFADAWVPEYWLVSALPPHDLALADATLVALGVGGSFIGVVGLLRKVGRDAVLLDQLDTAARLEMLGRLSGGLAHDMNNILTSTTMLVGELAHHVRGDREAEEDIEQILEACARGRSLTRNLLTVARQGKMKLEEVEPAELIRQTADLLTRTLPRSVEVGVDIEDGIPSIEGDRGLLAQCIINLAVNASQAMEQTGAVRIRARAKTEDGTDWLMIQVEDEGPGMSDESCQLALQPLFSTKSEEGAGTGLGLSQVQAIVERHHGRVSIESEIDEGTRVTLVLPASGHAEDDGPSETKMPIGGRTPTIPMMVKSDGTRS